MKRPPDVEDAALPANDWFRRCRGEGGAGAGASNASALGYSSGTVAKESGLKTLSNSELVPLCRGDRLLILLGEEASRGVRGRPPALVGDEGREEAVMLGSSYLSNCESVRLRR